MSAREEVRAEAFREGAAAIVAENDRMLWASKPGKHWAADLLTRMAETSDAVRELGALPMPVGRQLSEVERLQARVDEVERKYTFDTAELKRRIAELEKRLHDAAMTRTWRLENGKKFVYVEDIAPALLGLKPETDGITRQIAPTQVLRSEGEFYGSVHHAYRVSHDLPETGGQR